MKFVETEIPDVLIIEPRVFSDDRGFFMETWQRRQFAKAGMDFDFVQDNHSRSVQGVLRGLHYQIQQPQGKLLRVVFGAVFDVAVDIRKGSSTFGKWVGEVLSAENKKMFWVPPGFAHGFYVISPEAEFIYKCTDFYASQHERIIRWDDATLGIEWPLIQGPIPLLSDKDRNGQFFMEAEVYGEGFDYRH